MRVHARAMHFAPSLSVVVLSLLVVLGASCGESQNRIGETWGTLQSDFSDKLEQLTEQGKELQAQLPREALPAADRKAAALKARLDAAISEHSRKLEAAAEFFPRVGTRIASRLKTGKLEDARKAVEETREEWSRLVSDVEGAANDVRAASSRLQSYLADIARQIDSLGSLAAIRFVTGSADFSDIRFEPGTAELNSSDADSAEALAKLVTFMKTCPELTIELVGHTSREGSSRSNDRISLERAAAVRTYLISNGANENQIAAPRGAGGRENLMSEPDPASAEAREMEPAALEAIRNKNRRITVRVTRACRERD